MSVIGYIKRCTQCDIQMLVTVDYKHGDWCTHCIDEAISDTIDTIKSEESQPPPLHEPYETPLLPWERELLGRNDDDWPIGQVRG